ncbi:MAG: hypothetical protein PHS62_02905 [Patescibacteria group bacterium]|nr:hypothetical protein [Patescibacteria group bacterium]
MSQEQSKKLTEPKTWLSRRWHWLVLALMSIALFLGAASFNYFMQAGDFIKWSSPDEAANYNFAKLYAQEGRMSFFEKYNLLAADIIHPRSYLSVRGTIMPISFLGIILIYGKIAGLTSYKVLPYLTPLFAAIGVLFYFLLIKEVFGRRNALLSAMILTCFPPFIYYSARSMFHNVLFTVLLIAGLYFAVIMVARSSSKAMQAAITKFLPWVYAAAAGAFFGLAIIVRTSELVWLAPLIIILWLFNVKKIGLAKLIIFLAFLLVALLPAAYWNKILYQSYWQGGYEEMNQSITNIASAGQAIVQNTGFNMALLKNNLRQIKNNFFHFGFLPLKSGKMLYYYFTVMFYWLFWPAVFGSIWFLLKIKKWRRRHWAYLTAYTVIFIILLFYYGSWDFHDNPDPKSHTIGNSYTRYWLPIYLGAMPLASFFIIRLSKLLKNKILVYGCQTCLVIAIFFLSLQFVLVGSVEGLYPTVKKHLAARQEFNQVMSLTESRAIIITQYHDKLFFPERKVIVGFLNNDNMLKQYAILTNYLPIYYYNFTFQEKDFKYLNDQKLAALSLRLSPVKKIANEFTLYKLEKIKEPIK